MGSRGVVNRNVKKVMSQKRVIVTIERPDEHTEQLQQTLDISAAIAAGSTGIVTTDMDDARIAAQDAETAMASKAPGTAKTRNDAFQAMFIEQDQIKAELQKKVDDLVGTIDAKIALALSNGFHVQDFGTINKQDFVVVDGAESGDAKLVAKALEERSFHEWGFQNEADLDWHYIESSLQASKTVKGFTPGKKVKFRHRVFTKDGPGPWHYAEIIIR
jgi:hypothetical protein